MVLPRRAVIEMGDDLNLGHTAGAKYVPVVSNRCLLYVGPGADPVTPRKDKRCAAIGCTGFSMLANVRAIFGASVWSCCQPK